jgi:protein transport protein SEC39
MPTSRAHVLLDAVQYAAESDLKSLGQLISSNTSTLKLDLILRIILTYLPESTDPSTCIQFIQDVQSGGIAKEKGTSVESSLTKNLTKDEAQRKAKKLRLLSLDSFSVAQNTSDTFEKFLLCRAHRVDAEVGSVPLVQQLLEPFLAQYEYLRIWASSTVLPLLRFDYEYYPEHERTYTLEAFEKIHGRPGVDALLQRASEVQRSKKADYSKDIRFIIGPWIYGEIDRKRRKSEKSGETPNTGEITASCWSIVNEWLLDLAGTDYPSAILTYMFWDGPSDVDYGSPLRRNPLANSLALANQNYAQTGMAMVYKQTTSTTRSEIQNLLLKVSRLGGLPPPDFDSFSHTSHVADLKDEYLTGISSVHLLSGELLDSANPLTRPSSDSIDLAFLSSISVRLLDEFSQSLSVDKLLSLTLFGSAADQWSLFRKALHNMPSATGKDDRSWIDARQKLLWLRGWNFSVQLGQKRQGLFSQIDIEEFQSEILTCLLSNSRYQSAVDLYCRSSPPISSQKVERTILDAALASYDNASNGNKTRGGIKKASEIIIKFRSHFPQSQQFPAIWNLIQATHSLSYYSLTLQHGVPLLPVNIRVHPDPISLIDKVLKQNSGSYTKLDDLLGIGRDLVNAGLIKFTDPTDPSKYIPHDEALSQVERSITAKAISASLDEDDFDTAYSYIVNRLSAMSPDISTSNLPGVDLLWQAAYQAGRYQPKNKDGPSQLRRLEQRMELLSQALQLAPPSSLQEVLSTWRSCEIDLNKALKEESREEDVWQAKGDRIIPGGFSHHDLAPKSTKPRENTRKAFDEEAPMGLFDVARGAAAALSKSAFPLRAQREAPSMSSSQELAAGSEPGSPSQGEGRIRKRDMVSNMVTGGLASGIGWVIGKFYGFILSLSFFFPSPFFLLLFLSSPFILGIRVD